MTRNSWLMLTGCAILGSLAMGACSSEEENNNDSSTTGGVSVKGGASATSTPSYSTGGIRPSTTPRTTGAGGSNFFDKFTFRTSVGGKASNLGGATNGGGATSGGVSGVGGGTTTAGSTSLGGGTNVGGATGTSTTTNTAGATSVGGATGVGGSSTGGGTTSVGGTSTNGGTTALPGGTTGAGGTSAVTSGTTSVAVCPAQVLSKPSGEVDCSSACSTTNVVNGYSVTFDCTCTSLKLVCLNGGTSETACPATVFTSVAPDCKFNTDTTCSLTGTVTGLGPTKKSCTCTASNTWSCS